MDFEWDDRKRLDTLLRRGLDFADAAALDEAGLITRPDLRRDYGELRFNTYGYLDGVLCTYCWTPRNGRVRVISMRKANDRERRKY
jgi:uncharacterized DUF497 family protein